MSKHTPIENWTYFATPNDPDFAYEIKGVAAIYAAKNAHEVASLLAAAPKTAAERDELKEAKRELLEAALEMLSAFECPSLPHDSIGRIACNQVRAAIAKHSKGE